MAISDKLLSGSGATILWKARGYSDTYVKLEGFKEDSAISISDTDVGVTVRGVDGILSGGFVFGSPKMTIDLEANSNSRAALTNCYQAMKSQKDAYVFDFVIEHPGLKIRQTFSGFMTSFAGLTVQNMVSAGTFVFDIDSITEEEIA